MGKYSLVLDFDGVIHGYQSGWKGARVIPDPPVPGALKFIVEAMNHFEVNIFSSRSRQLGGRRAMKKWLQYHLESQPMTDWWRERVYQTAFADPWPDEIKWAAFRIVRDVKWPLFKPAAFVTIDDRALTFTGAWPSIKELQTFKPWNKK